jgi:DNA-binding NarL/FixJ family response regulator
VIVIPASSTDAVVRTPEKNGSIQTLIIDRQPLFRAALGSLLGAPPLSAQVGAAARSDMGLELIREGGFDIVFCELRAEPISGMELARLVGEESPAVCIILLADQGDEAQLASALSTSAAGLFTKNAPLEEFLGGVRAVLSGHRAIGSGLMGELLDRLSRSSIPDSKRFGSQLSPTELEILAMIGDAQSIPNIAASRGISDKTVRNHLAKIYRKLELHGRTEAMLWAARMGLSGN